MFYSWRKLFSSTILASFPLLLAGTAPAAVITDPAGDYLPSYGGLRNGDLDVLSAQVFFDGSNFLFTSTQAAQVGLTPGGIYVWGINRGTGTVGFPTLAPGVLFDSLVILNPAGGSSVRDLVTGVSGTVNNVTISGSTISGSVPFSSLLPRGFSPYCPFPKKKIKQHKNPFKNVFGS